MPDPRYLYSALKKILAFLDKRSVPSEIKNALVYITGLILSLFAGNKRSSSLSPSF
jgi:hypothetical protein